MRKLLGNGRPIAAAILAVGIAAIAVPAFGDSGGGSSQGGSGSRGSAGPPPFPPPPQALDGAMRRRAAKTAECMKSKAIPGARKRAHGLVRPAVGRRVEGFSQGGEGVRSPAASAARRAGAPGAALSPPPCDQSSKQNR